MSLSIDRAALDHLAALLLERAGLKITPDGYYGLRLALTVRMPALGISDAADYVRRLRQLAGEHELRALLPLVTVGKTEFFRDTRQFISFETSVLPRQLAQARQEGRPVTLWSAGCATGEEPYSLAMVAIEKGALPGEVDIWATDLNTAAIESAAKGSYPARRLVGVSEERLARFFQPFPDGSGGVVASVRALVRFEGHNLAAPMWPQVRAHAFDVIFCRNVIIYFDQPTILGLMERFYEALRPGGWLFLGYSETLFKIQTRFEMIEAGGAYFYRKPLSLGSDGSPRPVSSSLPPVAKAKPPAARPSAPPPRPSAPPPPVPSAPRPVVPARTPVQRLEEVVKSIESGDFVRALRTAKMLADDVPDDLAARLTLGNVHALMGNLDEAREAYTHALSREPLCVEARLYLAIAAMQVGRLDEARSELTRALFLEPTLAVGHYLLGQVCERRNEPEQARRAYRNAIAQRRAPAHDLIGHFPDLPRSNEAIAQAAQYRLAALSEA